LVYSLCAPSIGGGTDGLGGNVAAQKSPTGIAPDPETPPDYDPVIFIQPTYSFDRPLLASPQLTINPNTGLMRGRPIATGQYVVGVCVQEYVGGILLNEIRRDFQFNVADCERRVFADLESDTFLNDQYVIRSCGNRTVTVINESINEAFIEEYNWKFNLPGQVLEYDTRDVTVTFPDTGIYDAVLVLNPNSMVERCRDTARLQIGVFGAINSDFDFDYDTCVSGPVTFTELASTENDRIVRYRWDYDDGNFGDMGNHDYFYSIPGAFDVGLTVEDNRGCQAAIRKQLPYFPVPALVVAQPDRFVACNPGQILFNNLSEPVNEEYTINWDFGDGQFGEGLSIEHIYQNPGVYSVDIEIISPIGCQVDASFRNWILIKQSPDAGFVYTPQELNDLQREVFFTNQSTMADGFQWEFGDGGFAFEENPVHEYRDTGVFETVLIAFSDNGCTDTASAVLDIQPLNRYFLPNAFSPNDDGLNDEFTGKGLLKGVKAFSMTIWNRWGELVFETDDPGESWKGELNNGGTPSPKGVYHCRVEYVTSRGEQEVVETSLTLLR
jgi:gliding motility-associated-like protein